jgi:hypothetical protein
MLPRGCARCTRAGPLTPPPRLAPLRPAAGHYSCLQTVGTRQVQVQLRDHDPRPFQYDQVLEEGATQEDVFTGGLPG